MPGGIVNDDDHLGIALSWIGSGHLVHMSRKGRLKSSGFALSGLLFDPSGLFQQPGGQFATRDIEGGVAVNQIFIVPRPDHRPLPLDTQSSPKRRGQRKAGFILTEQHTLAELGFFLMPRSLLEQFVAFVGRL